MAPDEQNASDLRDLVRDALTQAGINATRAMVDALMDGIGQSIKIFRAEEAEFIPIRVQHDALRALFTLLDEDDPSPALIRVRFRNLPAPAAAYVMWRARVAWPRLMKSAFSPEVFDHWLATVPRNEHLRVLVTEGGIRLEGRSDDRPARSRFEPLIMGTTRGANDAKQRGGRPPKGANDTLVMHLALSWLHATEKKKPILKRTDTEGFPGLVHRIFQLYNLKGAESALRRYAEAVGQSGSDPEKPA